MVAMAKAENAVDEDVGEASNGMLSEKLRNGNEKAQGWVPLSF